MSGGGDLLQESSERKIRGGKLVRLRIIHDAERIRSIRITGDFLLHPEEVLEEIEMALCGLPIGSGRESFLEVIEGIRTKRGAQFIGFSPEDISDLIMEAIV